MIVLGLDPSLTDFGWAVHDTKKPVGDPSRCVERGRFQTPARMEFIDRFVVQRTRLSALIQRVRPARVGIEFPIFKESFSEAMYGLFLFCCEALKKERCDVVFWSPGQIKSHARGHIIRPKGWLMDKKDMVESARTDTGGGRWNHNEADAYLCGVLSGRFWTFYEGDLSLDDLSATEHHLFAEIRSYVRGKKAGKVAWRGTVHRENDRFFAWSNLPGEDADGSQA